MAYVVIFRDGPPALHLRQTMAAGSFEGVRDLWRRLDDGEEGISFRVLADDGPPIAEGAFHGEDRDRDVPLDVARLHAEGTDVDPVRVVYEDGRTWRYDAGMDVVLEVYA